MHWAAFVFGWPAAITSILLGALGLFGQRWKLVFAGAVVGLPFLAYLVAAGAGPWGLLAIAAAFAYFGSVAATSQHRSGVAWLLFAPMVILVFYVAAVVSGTQFR